MKEARHTKITPCVIHLYDFFFFSGTGDPRGPEIWSVTFRWWTWTLSTLILCIYPKGAGHNLEDDENGFYLILVVGTQKYIFDKIHWTLYLKKGDFRYMCVQSCPTFCDPWTAAHQAPLFPEFSRQEYWSGLPFPPPGDLPDPEIYKLYFTNPDLSVSLSFLSVSLFFSLSLPHTHTHRHIALGLSFSRFRKRVREEFMGMLNLLTELISS